MGDFSLGNIRIIRSRRDAEQVLEELAERKFAGELAAIRQAAQSMSCGKAGIPGRDQAIRAVLIGFSDNVDALEMAS